MWIWYVWLFSKLIYADPLVTCPINTAYSAWNIVLQRRKSGEKKDELHWYITAHVSAVFAFFNTQRLKGVWKTYYKLKAQLDKNIHG